MNSLLDSGSMITSISETGLRNLSSNPSLLSLDSLGLEVSLADGNLLHYKGYIECVISVPFFSDIEFPIPILVVPDTEVNRDCPVIIGTNVLRLYRDVLSRETTDIPETWLFAMKSIQTNSTVVKSTSKRPIQ